MGVMQKVYCTKRFDHDSWPSVFFIIPTYKQTTFTIVMHVNFQKLTDMKGVDIVVELGAHKMLEEDIKSLKKNGRIVVRTFQCLIAFIQ